MFRIGILGSDNSHAEAFSRLVNLPDEKGRLLYPDCKVTAIYGHDPVQTASVAAKGSIEYVADDPAELLSRVDAVMVVFRHGNLHKEYALPFVRAGLPVWIDKPFTITQQDALELTEAAARHNAILTGGSTCKYVPDILSLRELVNTPGAEGSFKAAALNFPATLENEYGGIYFYGAHLAEMTLAAFGTNPRSVLARENNGAVTALVDYGQYLVSMNFIPGSNQYCAVLYGKNTLIRPISIDGCYAMGFDRFANTLRTGKAPEPPEYFLTAVRLLEGVETSYRTGKEIKLL